jgi:hypothetical protein
MSRTSSAESCAKAPNLRDSVGVQGWQSWHAHSPCYSHGTVIIIVIIIIIIIIIIVVVVVVVITCYSPWGPRRP